MKEIIFAVTLTPDDVYTAEAFCYSIAVQAETLGELRCLVRSAVQCHFQDIEHQPASIRLHLTHYEEIKIVQSPEHEAEWQEACSEYSEHALPSIEGRSVPILGFKQMLER